MSFSVLLLAPLALLLPTPVAVDGDRADANRAGGVHAGESPGVGGHQARPSFQAMLDNPSEPAWPFRFLMRSFSADAVNQVRIEQRMTIRISPRASLQPDLLAELPQNEVGPRFIDKKMGKCLPTSRIAGVQTSSDNRLILYLRDQRIVSAELERACRARDFYSGFYLSRSADGMVCVDRDSLQSRNGANCKLTRLRELVEVD